MTLQRTLLAQARAEGCVVVAVVRREGLPLVVGYREPVTVEQALALLDGAGGEPGGAVVEWHAVPAGAALRAVAGGLR